MRRFNNNMNLVKNNPETEKVSEEELQKLLEKNEENMKILKAHLDEVQNDGLSFGDKINNILKINALIIPHLFEELTSITPNMDKSMIASRTISAIKETGNFLIKKHETEISDEINTNSPKFQLVFGWFLDLFHDILSDQGLETIQINNIFHTLSLELSGWEDKINKRLKGLSSRALAEVKNPFLEKSEDNK